MNDQTEILKRRFWDSIKPQESKNEKYLKDCSIYISSNLPPPPDSEIKDWTFLGTSANFTINNYKQSNYWEFDFEKSTDCIKELLILKHYNVLLVTKNVVSANKLHIFNNNCEFYLMNNRFYFRGFLLKDFSSNGHFTANTNNSTFLMIYFNNHYEK